MDSFKSHYGPAFVPCNLGSNYKNQHFCKLPSFKCFELHWTYLTAVCCFYLECNWTTLRKQIPFARTLEPSALELYGTLSFLLRPQTFLFDMQFFKVERKLIVYDPLIWQKKITCTVLWDRSLLCFVSIETSFRYIYLNKLN